MTAAAAWAGVVLALLSFVYTEKRFRDRRRTRLAIGPEPGVLREKLRRLGSLFDEVMTDPKDTAWFLGAEHKRIAVEVEEQAARVDDRELRTQAERAAEAWTAAFAHARLQLEVLGSTALDPQQSYPYKVEDAKRNARLELVSTHAETGRAAVDRAIKRLTELERNAPEL